MRLPHFLLAILLFGMGACAGESDAAGDPSLIHVVSRGDLEITVRERGELEAAEDRRVSCQLEGRNTLIYLIPEGTVVQAGEKLAELDASAIEEKRSLEAIIVARAQAALDQARKNFEIMEQELRALENTAQTRLKIAEMQAEKLIGQPLAEQADAAGTNQEMVGKLRDLLASEAERTSSTGSGAVTQHARLVDQVLTLLGSPASLELQMGEMANQILQQITAVELARSETELAADTLHHSETLAAKGFVTKNELDRDLIDHQRALSGLALAWNNLELLIHYTLPESRITTEQEVENAKLGLESTRATGEARRVREHSDRTSAEAEFALARERLENWTEQIESAVLIAPGPGLVVYGRWDWDEPVYEGMEVRQRQEVVILPNVTTMVAELKVHEAQIDKVDRGQRATMRLDAFPDRTFGAFVSDVSTLPDPTPSYRRSVKVYTVRVELDLDNSDGNIRPGMSALVEIDTGTLVDVLTIPIPALERAGDRHLVWKVTPTGPVATPVQLGDNNLTHVQILAGLDEGDSIHLVRPQGAELPDEDAFDTEDSVPVVPGGESAQLEVGAGTTNAGG